MKVEISIAIFNEEAILRQSIERLMHFLKEEFSAKKELEFSVIIADNGSTDNSEKIAKALTKEYSCLSFIKEENIGAGRVLKRAWQDSNADIVGYMDIDLATNLRHITEAIKAIKKGADIVAANRLKSLSKVIDRSFKRSFLSKIFNLFLRKFLKVDFADYQCGFKFLKREKAQELINTKLMSDGLFFASHILIYAQWLGFKIHQLPVEWQDSPRSKIRLFRFSLECISEIFKTKKNKKYIKVGSNLNR